MDTSTNTSTVWFNLRRQDQIGNIAYEGQEVSLSRHPIDPSQIAHTEDHFLSSQLNSSVPDSYYDYDSDEGYEISEATPDDDTAALDAKIDKLKGELISDTNLESYLNRILWAVGESFQIYWGYHPAVITKIDSHLRLKSDTEAGICKMLEKAWCGS